MKISRGFSLVEVVIAMGIFSFAIVVIISLLPAGMNLDRKSEDESYAVNALSAIIGDRIATPLGVQSKIYQLPALSQSNAVSTLYLNENYGLTNQTAALYKVEVTYLTPSSGSLSPHLLYCRVTWPATGTSSRGYLETIAAVPQISPLP